MDLWTFHRYQEPRLCVDAIDLDAHGRVALVQGGRTYWLAFDDAEAAAGIAQDLASLRDSGSPVWKELRDAPRDAGWGVIGAFLDMHSLIGEGSDVAAATVADRLDRVGNCIAATADAVLDGLPPGEQARIAANAVRLLAALDRNGDLGTGADPFDAAVEPNFFLGLITAEFDYFGRFAPLTLMAARVLVARMAGDRSAVLERAEPALEGAAICDLHDLESHLWLVGRALVESAHDTAMRMPAAPIATFPVRSGLEFMRQIEMATRETLRIWGENPYVTALDALNDRYSPLIAGPFIEQYHVTRRFVEIIAPLLSQRLAPPLRRMMFQYYSEEVGHEALESTTCEALGITQSALDQALPLPLHFAFVDMLTLVAEIDPVASFASIMVIEGVFGEPPRMSLRLAAVARTNPAFQAIGGDHDELNETLNHNSISRDAFEQIAALPQSTQARVMRRILFLLELNHRAWCGIADFYGRQHQLMLQGSAGRPLSPDGVLIR